MKEHKVIDDWVDPGEIRALAEKLMRPPKSSAGAEEDPSYGPDFEGFADPAEASGSSSPIGVTSVSTEARELEKKPEASPEPRIEKLRVSKGGQENPFAKGGVQRGGEPEKKPALGPLSPFRVASPASRLEPASERLSEEPPPVGSDTPVESFVNWLRGEIPLESCLIASLENEVVFDELRNAQLASVAKLLARAAHRRGGEKLPAMVVKLGAKRVMQVIPFRWKGKGFLAALVLPRPLADGGVRAFEKALAKALTS